MRSQDRIVFLTKVPQVRVETDEPRIRQQLDRALGLAHPERRLQREEAKRGIVKIIRRVYRQRFYERSLPGGKPVEFMQRVPARTIILYLLIVRNVSRISEQRQVHKLVR